jgi:hypothetical protein
MRFSYSSRSVDAGIGSSGLTTRSMFLGV